jgi:hypothetical protein
MGKFGVKSIVMRWLVVAGCLLATYNPSGRSFWHWIQSSDAALSVKLSIGLILIAGNYLFVRLTLRSLGWVGALMLAACVSASAWMLVNVGVVRIVSAAGWQAYVLIAVSVGLSIGVCWSAIRTRFSGQIDSDDISRRL